MAGVWSGSRSRSLAFEKDSDSGYRPTPRLYIELIVSAHVDVIYYITLYNFISPSKNGSQEKKQKICTVQSE